MRRSGHFFKLVTGLMLCALTASCAATTETEVVSPSVATSDVSSPTTEPTKAAPADIDDDVDRDPASTEFAGVLLDRDIAGELDRVGLVGLAGDHDPNTVAVMVIIGDIALPVEVRVDDDGPFFVAPLNPDNPGSDGSVEVFITDGDNDGARMRLELTGLPAAPGAGAEYAQAMRDNVDGQAQAVGSSFAELQDLSFEDTPAELERLKLLQGLIDDGSTNDLESALSAEESGLTAEQLALVDSIIAKTDPQASIQPPPPPASAAPPPPPPPPPGSGEQPPVTLAITPGTSADCNSSDIPSITSAEQLAAAMERGTDVQNRLSGASGTVLTDIKSTLLQSSLIPVAGPIIGTVGAVFSTAFLGDAPDAGRYPTSLTALTATVSTSEFNEDFGVEGNWSKVRVSATSTGYNATGDLIGLVVDSVGIVGGVAKARNVINNDAVDIAVDVGGKSVNSATGQFLASDAGPAFARFCSHTWTVLLKDNTYLAPAGSSLDTLVTDDNARTYAPTQIGEDQLVLTTKVFPGAQVTFSAPVTTHETFVQLEPNDFDVREPGDVVSIMVNFVHSDTQRVKWETTGGTFVDGLGDVTTGAMTRELETPGSVEGFDVTVTATLHFDTDTGSGTDSKQGLFADGRVKPSDETVLRLATLIVTPDGATLVTGASLQYAATTPDGEEIDVRWRAGGGSINSEGLYVAGDQPGTFTVTATSVSDSAVTDSVQVTIDELPDPECLHGVWKLRVDEMAEQMSRLTPDGSFLFVSGEYIISLFPDNTWSAERGELTFEIMAEGQTAVMKITSTESGTYSVTDQILSVTETSSDAVATITIPGIGEIGGPVPEGSSIAGSGVFTCADGVFTLTADGFTATQDYVGPTS